ncbi:flagellar hook-length control protein FliK [Paenibacillaceae bacterium WGS1546]|uniref:flagellar hook-length control protein FliK n=1 Tax=Cohnella sp. WGS1546 TaxID=3366810 RepID=UPI00372D21D4
MNMAILPASTNVGKSAAAVSVSGSSGGVGFAGALVQAIEGGGQPAAQGGVPALPVALVDSFGQAEGEANDGQADLASLLAALTEQLRALEEENGELAAEAEERLASLLAAFQDLLRQLSLANPGTAAGDGDAEASVTVPGAATIAEPQAAKPTLTALRETLQQLSAALASGAEGADRAAALAGQLKIALEANQPAKPNAAAPTATDDASAADETQPAARTATPLDKGAASAAKDYAIQTAQETRKAAQPPRDPAWRFQVAAATGTEEGASNAPATPAAAPATAQPAASANAQPLWSFVQNEALANAETSAAKPALPQQVPVQQFAEQIGKYLVKQFQLTQGNGTAEAKLTLTPAHLGQVDIRIVLQQGQLTAQFIADNSLARDLLENQMAQLRASLSGQGLQVDRLEVVQQPPGSSGATLQHQEHRHSNSGGQGGSGGNRGDEKMDDPADFAAELERNTTLKEFGYGSSLNVKA